MRPENANKRSVGVVTVVGGSGRYPNAPVIAGLGARAAGAGLVQLVVPDASRIAAGALVPEATFLKLVATCVPPAADVTVAGMGLGSGVNVQLLVSRLLSGSSGRFVLDADALGVLAGWYASKNGYEPLPGQEIILTPHEGEAARLLGCKSADVSAARIESAKEIASRYGATVVLKGAGTVVVSRDLERVCVNATGNPFMALGGMGDLLAGVVGARWAYLKCDPFLAAASSVWLHGAAGDALVASGGDPSIVETARTIGSLRTKLDRGADDFRRMRHEAFVEGCMQSDAECRAGLATPATVGGLMSAFDE